MDIAPIKSHRDYRRVLGKIERLMNAGRDSSEGDRLDILVTLVEVWERKRCALDYTKDSAFPPSP
jgi:HTH-type transcriptional regulator/antitoxin HigA